MSNSFTQKQQENLEYFNSNIEAFLQNPLLKNKYVVIHEKALVGAYDSFSAALNYAVAELPRGEYIVEQILSEKDTINFIYSAV